VIQRGRHDQGGQVKGSVLALLARGISPGLVAAFQMLRDQIRAPNVKRFWGVGCLEQCGDYQPMEDAHP
jgi:hypothetical protein